MIQPIRCLDDPLLKDIPESVTKFEYGNMIIVILHPEKKEPDWLIINKETPGIYYHMYQKKSKLYFHKTYNLKNGRKKHEHIDLEKSMKKLGEILSNFFSKAEKIEINDGRFVGKFVYFLTQHQLYVKGKTEEKVIFGQNYNVEDIPFEKIDKNFHKLGFVFDENNKEKDMIFVQNERIFHCDFTDQIYIQDLIIIFNLGKGKIKVLVLKILN